MEAVARLIAAARSAQNASDMFDETVGQLLGINRTDGRCGDIIQRFGRMTAGQLAEQSGLTTGAVTTVIDRLEAAGYVQRVRDDVDRRRVFVELTDYAKKLGEMLYAPMSEVFSGAMRNVSMKDLKIISEYLEFADRVSRRHAELMRDYMPAATASDEDRLQRVKSFARGSRKMAPELIESWGAEPTEPPIPGKLVM